MHALSFSLVSFFTLSASVAMDISKYGIPNSIRTGSAIGEANATASPGAIRELLNGDIEGAQRPPISSIQVRRLADELSSKAHDLDRAYYTPAVKAHVPVEFSQILSPEILNNVGFSLTDDTLKLAQNYIKLGLDIQHLPADPTDNRKRLISYAFVLAANKLEEIGLGINNSDRGLPVEQRKLLTLIKLDLAVSKGQLYSWALRQSPHEPAIREAMVDALAESAALMPYITKDSLDTYLPKYTCVYNNLGTDEKSEAGKIITARVVKSLALAL